jgi:hypothetical protein
VFATGGHPLPKWWFRDLARIWPVIESDEGLWRRRRLQVSPARRAHER